jgi:hypothetical protein
VLRDFFHRSLSRAGCLPTACLQATFLCYGAAASKSGSVLWCGRGLGSVLVSHTHLSAVHPCCSCNARAQIGFHNQAPSTSPSLRVLQLARIPEVHSVGRPRERYIGGEARANVLRRLDDVEMRLNLTDRMTDTNLCISLQVHWVRPSLCANNISVGLAGLPCVQGARRLGRLGVTLSR